MTTPLSVSELNEQIKNLLETTFVRVYVEGELSRITYHNSGHIYFTLKDVGSAVSCVMFRGNATKLRFRLEEGLKVVIDGAISVYKPRGQYQINAFMIEPSGHGALALAYEQLKQRLSDQGYFDPSCKKALPKIPQRIALITSATGAAVQDMQRVAAQRWPLVAMTLYDTVVQGEMAAPSIVRNLNAADSAGYDLIIVGRGGGSIEDLWAFNEEAVADAIFHAHTPVVSAVGHEIDWVISDFVADLRAPTPSAAMQMILPDSREMMQSIDSMIEQYEGLMRERFYRYQEHLDHLQQGFERHSIEQRIIKRQEEIRQLRQQFDQSIHFSTQRCQRLVAPLTHAIEHQLRVILQSKNVALNQMRSGLEQHDPKRKSKRGFAQIVQDEKITSLETLKKGEYFEALNDRVKVSAQVIETQLLTPSKN